jgi:hypothetical protein
LLKHDSHSGAISVCRSWTSSALWRYVMALIRTYTNKLHVYYWDNAIRLTDLHLLLYLITYSQLHQFHSAHTTCILCPTKIKWPWNSYSLPLYLHHLQLQS